MILKNVCGHVRNGYLMSEKYFLCFFFPPQVCKSCIVKHFFYSNKCPTCSIVVHQTQPLYNIRWVWLFWSYRNHLSNFQVLFSKGVSTASSSSCCDLADFYARSVLSVDSFGSDGCTEQVRREVQQWVLTACHGLVLRFSQSCWFVLYRMRLICHAVPSVKCFNMLNNHYVHIFLKNGTISYFHSRIWWNKGGSRLWDRTEIRGVEKKWVL